MWAAQATMVCAIKRGKSRKEDISGLSLACLKGSGEEPATLIRRTGLLMDALSGIDSHNPCDILYASVLAKKQCSLP